MSKNINVYRVWLFLLVFSFFYELPLITLTFDRLNPRLLDVTFIIGVLLYLTNNGGSYETNQVYNRWRRIVLWFLVCAIISVVFLLPSSYRLFSFLAALRYVESLLLIGIALSMPIDKKTVFHAAYLRLLLDSVYCIFQYGHPTVRELSPGNFVTVDYLTGPLSSSYFEISQLLPLAVVLILALAEDLKMSKSSRAFYQVSSILMCWPLLFTGSRTGLLLGAISLMVYLFTRQKKNYVLIILLAGISVFFVSRFDKETSDLYTITRAMNLEEDEHDSFGERIEVSRMFDFESYDNALIMPLFGAGFDVAPVNGNYRVDYGVHSMFLYPLEQSGIMGFVLFVLFLWFCLKYFYRNRKVNPLAMGAFSYLVAMMITGIGAHNFWREFSSGNVNTFIVLVFCLAYKFSYEESKSFAH